MATKHLAHIDLNKNELQNAKAHPLAVDPTPAAGDKGYIIYNTATNQLKVWNGTSFDVASVTFPLRSTVAAGANAGSPDYSFSGDTNTGIYSSAADTLDFATGGTNRLSISSTGVLTLNSAKITGVADPSASSDVVTLNYFNNNVSTTLDWKGSCRVATTGAETSITISAGAATQINGLTVDGVTVAIGDRILVKNAPAATGAGSGTTTGSTQPANGIYRCTANTTNLTITRDSDASTSALVTTGMTTHVSEGTVNADADFALVTNDPITLNTTALTFSTKEYTELGTAALPSYSFLGDSDTGIYSSAANTVNLSVGGISNVQVASNLYTFGNSNAISGSPNLTLDIGGGTASNPVITLKGWSASTPATGTITQVGSTGNMEFAVGTGSQYAWKTGGAAGTVAFAMTLTQVQSNRAAGANAGSPDYSFVNDPNTGIYSSAADTLDFSTGGVNRLSLNATTSLFGNGVLMVDPVTGTSSAVFTLTGRNAGTANSATITTAAGGSVTYDTASTATSHTFNIFGSNRLIVSNTAITVGSIPITGVSDPSGATDVATKNYVDNLAAGIDARPSVRAATTGAETSITIASGAATTIAGTTVDGITVAINDRILVKNAPAVTGAAVAGATSSNPANGLYRVTANTTNLTITRAVDMDTWAEVPNAYVWVEQGTVNADSGWVSTADTGGTLNTTAIPWSKFVAAGVKSVGYFTTLLGTVTGGTGLTITAATHGLTSASRALQVQVLDETGVTGATAGDVVYPDINIGSTGTITITFTQSFTANSFRVNITGATQ